MGTGKLLGKHDEMLGVNEDGLTFEVEILQTPSCFTNGRWALGSYGPATYPVRLDLTLPLPLPIE